MGIRAAYPTQRELPLSNQTRFSLAGAAAEPIGSSTADHPLRNTRQHWTGTGPLRRGDTGHRTRGSPCRASLKVYFAKLRADGGCGEDRVSPWWTLGRGDDHAGRATVGQSTLVAGVQHVGHVQPNGACPTPYGLRSECLNSVLGLGHAHDPIVGGKVPSYLGSSFAFIGPVLAATGAIAGGARPRSRARRYRQRLRCGTRRSSRNLPCTLDCPHDRACGRGSCG